MAKRRSPYGRGVLGNAEFERQKRVQKKTRNIYGPAVTGISKEEMAPKTLEGGDAKETDAQLSVKEVGKLLQRDPSLLDRQIEAEFMRPDPRKSAIRLFIEYERKRPEGQRADVLKYLERSLQADVG